jgi:hypothetical protein
VRGVGSGVIDKGVGGVLRKEPVKRWRGWHGALEGRREGETGRADWPKKQRGIHRWRKVGMNGATIGGLAEVAERDRVAGLAGLAESVDTLSLKAGTAGRM